jgi:hypothetical protein
VIPLGPLGLNEIVSGGFATIGRYWKQLFGLAALVYGGALLVIVAAACGAYVIVADDLHTLIHLPSGAEPSWDTVRPLLVAFGCLWVFGLLTFLATMAMMQAICPVVVQDAVLGRPATFRGVWSRAAARMPAVAGTILLTGLIAYVPVTLFLLGFMAVLVYSTNDGSETALRLIPLGLGIFALIPVGIWLWVRFSLAPTVAVIESRGPVAALRRSAGLVRGAWWRIFGISLLASLLAGFVGWILEQGASLFGLLSGLLDTSVLDDPGRAPTAGELFDAMGGYLILMLCVQLISQVLLMTFPQLILNLLYIDRRIRTEDLAATLAEAAGVPSGPAGPYAG